MRKIESITSFKMGVLVRCEDGTLWEGHWIELCDDGSIWTDTLRQVGADTPSGRQDGSVSREPYTPLRAKHEARSGERSVLAAFED